MANKVIYTGQIDRYFNYLFGQLDYRSTLFLHILVAKENYQGAPIVTFTNVEVPYTRIILHKHFSNVKSNISWITKLCPVLYIPDVTEPLYPVNNSKSNNMYIKYTLLAKKLKNVIFGGRIAEFKYYDMDLTILSAMNCVNNLKL